MAKKRTERTPRKPARKAAPRKRTRPDWAGAFLAALAGTANVRAACLAAKCSRSNVYQRRDSDPEFHLAMALALEDATDELELEARRRALEGVERPVFGSGGTGVGTVEVGRVREYSDSLMMFLLKAHRPEKFRERHEVKHTGRLGLAVTAEDMSDDELAAVARGDG